MIIPNSVSGLMYGKANTFTLHLIKSGKVFATKQINDIAAAHDKFGNFWAGKVCDSCGDLISDWEHRGELKHYLVS